MNRQSCLKKEDYEDFFIYVYFGSGRDYLAACIDRAYLDFCRTLTGIGNLSCRSPLRKDAGEEMKNIFMGLTRNSTGMDSQDSFDKWHKRACYRLKSVYGKWGYEMFVGQCQKWVNMTFKYIYLLGEERLSGYQQLYPFCHVPLVNVLLTCLAKKGFPSLSCAWSRLDDYPEYIGYQRQIRAKFVQCPLDVEFQLWLGKDVELFQKDGDKY